MGDTYIHAGRVITLITASFLASAGITSLKLLHLSVALLLLLGSTASAETVLITGANSGIGLEFAKQYAARGAKVIATHRRTTTPDTLASLKKSYPDAVTLERIDVRDLEMIQQVADKYRGTAIDILISNAGIVADLTDPTPQMFGSLDYELFNVFMETNVRGPLKMAEAFHEHVKQSDMKRIIAISSLSGSLSEPPTRLGGRIYYKTSKAALNMAMITIARATAIDGIVVASLHPGGVKVEKLEEFNVPGFMSPSESVGGMVSVIDALTPEQSGSFLDWEGRAQSW